MKRASTATTHTRRSPGHIDRVAKAAGRPEGRGSKRSPRIALVVACAQRKHPAPTGHLRLGSVKLGADQRQAEWLKRLDHVEAPLVRADDLYAGDHWQAALTAYRLAQRVMSRAELWVISAGYGLTSASKLIKPYGATFASGSPDSVWRGEGDGTRLVRLREWWRGLPHDLELRDLLDRRDGRVVIAAGDAYLDALADDLALLLQEDSGDQVSVISAGSRGNGCLLPVDGRFRAAVGGTDAALNARLLALLADDAEAHEFRRSAMAAMLTRKAKRLPDTKRSTGRPASDETISRKIKAIQRRHPGINRTQALRELRHAGTACEQSRFAAIWDREAGAG